MIIGIVGTIGSGKGTVVEYLKQRGFVHYSSSSLLKEILREQGVAETRQNMSTLADKLLVMHEGGILHVSHDLAEKNGVKDYILEAIHRPAEADYVRSIGGKIIGVDADIKVRYGRISRRNEGEKDNVTYEQFLIDAAREDEGSTGTGPNIRAVLKDVDCMLNNNDSLENLHIQIDAWLARKA